MVPSAVAISSYPGEVPISTLPKVLEIGVETGRSHRLWLEYFPNARIYGYDIFKYGYDELQRLQKDNPF